MASLNPQQISRVGFCMVSGTGFQAHSQFHSAKMRLKSAFLQPCTSAASESEFDHVNRIQCLKSRRASLYPVKDIKMSWLAMDRLLVLESLQLLLRNRLQNYLSLDTQYTLREDNSDMTKAVPIRSQDDV